MQCPAGRAAGSNASVACTECPTNAVAGKGATTCAPCLNSTFSSDGLFCKCNAKFVDLSSDRARPMCVACKVSHDNRSDTRLSCTATAKRFVDVVLQTGMRCVEAGLRVSQLQAEPGYYVVRSDIHGEPVRRLTSHSLIRS